ncbi:hypothetical protein Tco_1387920, partial [Tanacetum coccineum]
MVAYLQMYALTESPTIYVSLIEQFWQTAIASTLENGDMEITATIDGKVKETEVPHPSSSTQTHVADEAASIGIDVRHGGAATTISSLDAGRGSGNIDKTPAMPHDSPLPRSHTLGSDKGRMQHNELMDLVTKLSNRIVSLETDLQQTKKVYGDVYTKLIKKVKMLEHKLNKSRRKRRLVLSKEEDSDTKFLANEDPSKQGRKIAQIDKDEGITLFTTAEDVSTANVSINTASAEISTVSPKVKTTGVSINDVAAEASNFKPEEWNNIQAQIEADEELAH